MLTSRLAVFARLPVPGQVKTRLSPALPGTLAAELYRAMLADTLVTASLTTADERVLYWATSGAESPDFTVPPGFSIRRQTGADLGERLAGAFAELLIATGDRAVIVGADCPDLGPTTIQNAFAALTSHDLVLGPARDGGYYLIGLKTQAPALFEGVAWGTEQVRAETLARAGRAGLTHTTLDEFPDLDTPDDLVRFIARRSVSGAGSGQGLEQALRGIGLLPPRT